MNFNYLLCSIMLIVQFFITGCASVPMGDAQLADQINWQFRPNAPETKEVKDVVVTYMIPNYISKKKNMIDSLHFSQMKNFVSKTRQEKLFICKNDPNLWIIERRTDNGVAGSGIIYEVKVSEEKINSNTKISFSVVKESTYQEGMILPYAVPDFNIKKYLSSARIKKYSFELNSEYDLASVRANFDRLLEKISIDVYFFETEDASYKNYIEFYPYRGGTKIVVKSDIYNMQTEDNIIEVEKFINVLRNKIRNVVDA